MALSLVLPANPTRSAETVDYRFWLLFAAPLAGLFITVLSMSVGLGGGVAAAIIEVAGTGI